MGRKKTELCPILNDTSRQIAFTKRKESIIKKAHELAVLCDTEVALIMFSPGGSLVTFASKGSVEDIFLRFLNMHPEAKRMY
ncbi:hypothetical protein M569_13601, partial [Genlisea aurea]